MLILIPTFIVFRFSGQDLFLNNNKNDLQDIFIQLNVKITNEFIRTNSDYNAQKLGITHTNNEINVFIKRLRYIPCYLVGDSAQDKKVVQVRLDWWLAQQKLRRYTAL